VLVVHLSTEIQEEAGETPCPTFFGGYDRSKPGEIRFWLG